MVNDIPARGPKYPPNPAKLASRGNAVAQAAPAQTPGYSAAEMANAAARVAAQNATAKRLPKSQRGPKYPPNPAKAAIAAARANAVKKV